MSKVTSLTQGERITALEIQVGYMAQELEKAVEKMSENNEKLEELVSLKNRGMGAFWLASTVLGAGVVGILMQLFSWFRG